jgi:hypothetical protein
MTKEMNGLDGLPVELLTQVALYLNDSHPPSRAAFSAVDRKCHAGAWPATLQALHIPVGSRKQLARDVKGLLDLLEKIDGHQLVRRLRISGGIVQGTAKCARPAPVNELAGSNSGKAVIAQNPQIYPRQLWEAQTYVQPHLRKPDADKSCSGQWSSNRCVANDPSLGWEPCVRLLRALPRLQELNFDC